MYTDVILASTGCYCTGGGRQGWRDVRSSLTGDHSLPASPIARPDQAASGCCQALLNARKTYSASSNASCSSAVCPQRKRKILCHAFSRLLPLARLAAVERFCQFPEWRLDRKFSNHDSGMGGSAVVITNSEYRDLRSGLSAAG